MINNYCTNYDDIILSNDNNGNNEIQTNKNNDMIIIVKKKRVLTINKGPFPYILVAAITMFPGTSLISSN